MPITKSTRIAYLRRMIRRLEEARPDKLHGALTEERPSGSVLATARIIDTGLNRLNKELRDLEDESGNSSGKYLHTPYEPRYESAYGVLVSKATGIRKQGKLEARIILLIEGAFPMYEAIPESTVHTIPDLIVDRRDQAQKEHRLCVHLCIQIVSPEDDLAVVFAKCESYHAWGNATYLGDRSSDAKGMAVFKRLRCRARRNVW